MIYKGYKKKKNTEILLFLSYTFHKSHGLTVYFCTGIYLIDI